MSEIRQAIADIAEIRAQMAASTRFRGYAPEAVGLLGLLSMAVMGLQLGWPGRFAESDRHYLILWGALLGAGCLVISAEAIWRTMQDKEGMASPMLLAMMRIVLPSMFIATVVPIVILAYAPRLAWTVPGLWQMLTAMVAIAGYPAMPCRIVWPGLWLLLSGGAGMLLAGQHGGLSPLPVGVPFIVGHFAIAWVLFEEEHNADAG